MTINISTPEMGWYEKQLRGTLEIEDGAYAVTRGFTRIEADSITALVAKLKEMGVRHWGANC